MGEGREDVERVGSSKVKSGSGKKSRWLVIRASRVLVMKTTWER